MLMLAGKVLRGEAFTEREASDLKGYQSIFPSLANPVLVGCSVPDHRTGAAVVFTDEVIKDGVVGNIREKDGRWICTACGTGDNVREEVVRVIR
jgi:hypothetical protein